MRYDEYVQALARVEWDADGIHIPDDVLRMLNIDPGWPDERIKDEVRAILEIGLEQLQKAPLSDEDRAEAFAFLADCRHARTEAGLEQEGGDE